MNSKERIENYKKSRMFEKEIVRAAETTVKILEGTMYYSLIHGITMDSEKHAYLLDALIKMLSERKVELDKTKILELQHNINEHIDLEKKAIENYKKILDIKEPLLEKEEREIVKHIYEDEKVHHRTLERIKKVFLEK
ncbi:MAG: hypothetical protein ACFFAU_08750 [Candidatus Hodarchaeota archaeon]